jgi:hypothetical protein
LKYVFLFFIACAFVLITGFTDGIRIEKYEEIETKFPYNAGFPISFVELNYPKIAPPLPYTYSGACCFMYFSWDKYWYSVLIVFVFFICLKEMIKRFKDGFK